MKCLTCKKTFKDTLDKCPFCHTKVENTSNSSNEEFKDYIELIEKMEQELSKTIELKPTKKKKRDNSEVSLDKTVAINVLNDNNSSLLDEINKQIDKINEESKQEQTKEITLPEEELTTLESFKKRRKILILTSLASLALIVLMLISLIISSNIKFMPNKSNIDYNQATKKALNTYYETSEIDDLIYVMEDIKKDSEKVTDLQDTVKNTCYGWVIRYKEENAKSTKEFEDITFKYKELIDGIYRYALVKNKDQYIRALKEIDYDELMLQFDTIYTDSLIFYEGLDLYNNKDYNKAYYMFTKIEKENSYYDKSITHINKIYENILSLLKKDIKKIEKNIDTLSNEEKLSIYILVEETILEYNNVYTVNLSDNEEYQKILSSYTSKVSQYTDIVYNNKDIN